MKTSPERFALKVVDHGAIDVCIRQIAAAQRRTRNSQCNALEFRELLDDGGFEGALIDASYRSSRQR